jgi:hypothetical protein
MAMVQRLRARFHVPADLLLPPAEEGAIAALDETGRRLNRYLRYSVPDKQRAIPRAHSQVRMGRRSATANQYCMSSSAVARQNLAGGRGGINEPVPRPC